MSRVDRTGFGKTTTTADVLAGISLEGKTALVTGASGELGAETARALPEKRAAITPAVRDLAKSERVD